MKRVQLISLLASLGLLGIILELVRQKLLKERFALLWLLSALILVLFSLWADFLEILANAMGIYYAPAVLLPIMLLFGVILFLYFSVVVTKQGDEIKTLSQNAAILEERIKELEDKGEEKQ